VQLLNAALQFRDLAPSGMISNKEFAESMQRLSALSVSVFFLSCNVNVDFKQGWR
jgi:hypothetical protein